jgi:hypothetical protein
MITQIARWLTRWYSRRTLCWPLQFVYYSDYDVALSRVHMSPGLMVFERTDAARAMGLPRYSAFYEYEEHTFETPLELRCWLLCIGMLAPERVVLRHART